MSYSEEIEKANKWEKQASIQLQEEWRLYFQTYEEWKEIMKNAGLEIENITITRRKNNGMG